MVYMQRAVETIGDEIGKGGFCSRSGASRLLARKLQINQRCERTLGRAVHHALELRGTQRITPRLRQTKKKTLKIKVFL
ncbi:hypothetical protein JW321_20025 [Pseudomonas syringae pv. papulans]|uniref:Uncharacterized protein n=1 Tax=Pseudomonas syringae pv. papulans TaxID=83963 RepID=A0AA43IXX9_PSESX|nr:hypothetical protein [Pseudomonas syringae]KWS31867.1 hypothetical protein AL059_02240 [Pseudomonas syringae pv. papulans]MDH4605012.1 hypothetical protein [Pseudomonas syringae pv. papulans]MDH4624395.1 hypothetical protein [Pseudomonas syringae pv. papulans]